MLTSTGLRAPLLRLAASLSTISAGAGAGGAAGGERQREGERDEGVGALSHRDPLEEEPHGSAAPRACVRARGRTAAPRGGRKEHKRKRRKRRTRKEREEGGEEEEVEGEGGGS